MVTVRNPHRRRVRLTAIAAATAVAVLVTAGCSSSDDSNPAGGGSTGAVDLSSVSLTVGQTSWTATQAALQVARLDNTPYKVQWPVFSGGDQQLQALQSGALDVAQSSEIPPIFAAAGGTVRFKQVAVQTGNTLLQEVIVGKDSQITSIAGLKGKKVGFVKNTTAAYFLNELLKQSGLTWKDIEPRPLLPNDGLAALNGGSIDAFASYGNSLIAAHQSGAKTIGSGADILSGNFPWSVTESVLKNTSQQAAVVDLLARINRAFAYVRDGHQQDYAVKFAAGTKQSEASALTQFEAQEKQRPTSITAVSAAAEKSQQRVADSLSDIKALPGTVNVSDLWTDQLSAQLNTALAAAPASAAPSAVAGG